MWIHGMNHAANGEERGAVKMAENYIVSIDQSTQGTKALLFDSSGAVVRREDISHRQIVNEKGWVSHDAEEIYRNTLDVVRRLVERSGIGVESVRAVGISNQRETCLAWDKVTGKPVADAIVWQCSRAEDICARLERRGAEEWKNVDAKENGGLQGHVAVGEWIRRRTGLTLSAYFPAAKLAWLLENVEAARRLQAQGRLCMGTIDTWLLYCLTKGAAYKTDYSNASRTQLFNIHTLRWDEEICRLFGVDTDCLAEVCDSDSCFGESDFEGTFPRPIPIHGMLGDSHAALFAQGCTKPGMVKATYGTGSSIMMNTGMKGIDSTHGVVTSLAWKLRGEVNYVLEGNINYTGAVISWLKDEVRLIDSPNETENLCREALPDDELYLVPAFSGLGAPHWNSQAKGILSGITRTTGRNEIVRAAVESIAWQIADVVEAFLQDADVLARELELRVDGGPTKNRYLMQFQSDILDAGVMVSHAEEMSAAGAAYVAGIAIGIYDMDVLQKMGRTKYLPQMDAETREKKQKGWKAAVGQCMYKE